MPSFDNPFTVQTPEDIPAEEAVALFVPVFGDFPKVDQPGHVFLHGPRGSGKSMILRYLQPDCQMLVKATGQVQQLDYLALYVPLKNCDLKITELQRLEGQHASVILNEHFMVMYIATKILAVLAKLPFDDVPPGSLDAVQRLFRNSFLQPLISVGYPGEEAAVPSTVGGCFHAMQSIAEDLFTDVTAYLRRIAFATEAVPFNGPLCGYLDFLMPLLKGLREMPFMPNGDKPLFLLIDDADNLNLTQTRILNSWVSSRTSSIVSLKISTQLQYKTRYTVTGQTIDTPHDFSEVNISTIYTAGGRGQYKDRVRAIVQKRLELFQIETAPEDFFPPDEKQEAAIAEIVAQYRANWETSGRGARPEDDSYRYARPDYIKSLGGTSKSSHTYSYSGFEQLVHLSSGIVRYFLEAASQMYSAVRAASGNKPVCFIPPGIQSEVVRSQANDFLFEELGRLRDDESEQSPEAVDVVKLMRLVLGLGGMFQRILLSARSERRVFSIAFTDEPSDELRRVLRLGIRYGYFHESTIGNKDGTGRTRLYILSRRLAPLFNLDPTSFAGYLFVRSTVIEQALVNPDSFLRGMEPRINASSPSEDVLEDRQLRLFD